MRKTSEFDGMWLICDLVGPNGSMIAQTRAAQTEHIYARRIHRDPALHRALSGRDNVLVL